MAKKLNIKIGLNVKIFFDAGYYIAYSPELQISTYAKTEQEVKERFSDRLAIFFEHAISKGDLHDRLTSLGWRFVKKLRKTTLLPPEDVTVPAELLAAQQCHSEQFSYAV